MDFKNIFPNDLYHSYVIESNMENTATNLKLYLEDHGEVDKNSSDIMFASYDSFGMEDSIIIKEWYQNKVTDGKKKICIINTKFINREAEQSLLKVIEEPTENTHFFIITPDASLLLDTILSRVHLIKNVDEGLNEEYSLEFYKLNINKRLDKIADIIKEFKDNENSGGLRYKAISLINGIERIVYEKWKMDINNTDLVYILNELKNCREYLSIPGASVKMILEYIALVI